MGVKSEEKRNQRRLHLMTYLGGTIPYVRPKDYRGPGIGTSQHILVKTRDNRKFKQVRIFPPLTPAEKRNQTHKGNEHWQAWDTHNREVGLYK